MAVMDLWVMAFSPFLQELPNYYVYQKVGQQWEHPTSHYGTFNTVWRIQRICESFYQETGLVGGVNDMSLPWGGVFDLGPRYGGVYWASPHSEHKWGLNADMPFQYLGTTLQRDRFRQIAVAEGATIVLHGDHFHLQFPN